MFNNTDEYSIILHMRLWLTPLILHEPIYEYLQIYLRICLNGENKFSKNYIQFILIVMFFE